MPAAAVPYLIGVMAAASVAKTAVDINDSQRAHDEQQSQLGKAAAERQKQEDAAKALKDEAVAKAAAEDAERSAVANRDAQKARLKSLAAKGGRSSTILTGPLGLTGGGTGSAGAPTAGGGTKTLLGS